MKDRCVICYDEYLSSSSNSAYFGQASSNSSILLDDVRCTGQEASITDCVRSDWYVHNCHHYEDAGVSCTSKFCYITGDYHIYCLKLDYFPDEYPLRLVGGSTPAQGRLEVFYNGQWGSVCDDYFGGVEARVSVLYM